MFLADIKALGYSAGDWDPATAPKLASVNSDKIYEGFVYFAAAGEFKITQDDSSR